MEAHMDFPITVADFLTIAGVSLFATLVTQWLKEWITEPRVLNLVALALALVGAIVAQLVITHWQPTDAQVFAAVLIGFFGGSLATFGYETIQNLRGLLGKGSRA
jgi:drug/metabolite transporter (DMT)-like permease